MNCRFRILDLFELVLVLARLSGSIIQP
jgi:hypothetical protein